MIYCAGCNIGNKNDAYVFFCDDSDVLRIEAAMNWDLNFSNSTQFLNYLFRHNGKKFWGDRYQYIDKNLGKRRGWALCRKCKEQIEAWIGTSLNLQTISSLPHANGLMAMMFNTRRVRKKIKGVRSMSPTFD